MSLPRLPPKNLFEKVGACGQNDFVSFEDFVSTVRCDETDVNKVVILTKLSNRAQEVVAEVVPPKPEAFAGRDHVCKQHPWGKWKNWVLSPTRRSQTTIVEVKLAIN